MIPQGVRLPKESISRLQVDTRTEHQKRSMRALARLKSRVEQGGVEKEFSKTDL